MTTATDMAFSLLGFGVSAGTPCNEVVCLAKSVAPSPILKIDEEQQQVFGVVLDACTEHSCTPDTQGDIMVAREVETAAHGFMVALQSGVAHIAVDHKRPADASVIESMIVPADFEIGDPPQLVRKGSWYLGLEIHDAALWESVRDGRRTAFSIGGSATRVAA